jgi:hypothetical protein
VLVSYNHSNPLIGSQLAILVSANLGGLPGLRGGRLGREALAAPDSLGTALATVLPATPGLLPLTADVSPTLGNRGEASSALVEAGSACSVDQVFTRLGEDLVAGTRHHHHTVAVDEIDPLLPDLLGQAGVLV